MAILQPYRQAVSVRTEDELVDLFLKTLAVTNRTHDFFVDWKKVQNNVNAVKTEIAILGSIRGSNDFAGDLRLLLRKYPEVSKAIPMLIAVRDLRFSVLEDMEAANQYTKYDFSRPPRTDAELEAIVRFCIKTGIDSLVTTVQVLADYVMGVEVGTDTNARKNRSGSSMEHILFPVMQRLSIAHQGVRVIFEKLFSSLEGSVPFSIPHGLRDRRFDIVVVTAERAFNVETNFYSGGGSKPQEIVDSYINRHRELAQAGWGFVWVTDGEGWRTGENQMRKAFREMDYILNLELVRRGILDCIFAK